MPPSPQPPPSAHLTVLVLIIRGNGQRSATGSYLSTYYFVFLFIPIFPICRYRVTSSGDSYRFFGKAPLRSFDKWHLAISIGLIVLLIILASSVGSTSTPSIRPVILRHRAHRHTLHPRQARQHTLRQQLRRRKLWRKCLSRPQRCQQRPRP